MILCKSDISEEMKSGHKIDSNDEVYCFFGCDEALAWLMMEESKPDLILVDLEDKNCQGDFFITNAKRSAPKADVMGIYPSQKNEP
ncbi:MAG: hypothetical protein WC678_00510 [Parcubacteria group bacterium]